MDKAQCVILKNNQLFCFYVIHAKDFMLLQNYIAGILITDIVSFQAFGKQYTQGNSRLLTVSLKFHLKIHFEQKTTVILLI